MLIYKFIEYKHLNMLYYHYYHNFWVWVCLLNNIQR